jgi:hypothetical protein
MTNYDFLTEEELVEYEREYSEWLDRCEQNRIDEDIDEVDEDIDEEDDWFLDQCDGEIDDVIRYEDLVDAEIFRESDVVYNY